MSTPGCHAEDFPGIAVAVLRSPLHVDLGQLAVGPLGRVLGRHALDRLGVHVDDDVLVTTSADLRSGGPA